MLSKQSPGPSRGLRTFDKLQATSLEVVTSDLHAYLALRILKESTSLASNLSTPTLTSRLSAVVNSSASAH